MSGGGFDGGSVDEEIRFEPVRGMSPADRRGIVLPEIEGGFVGGVEIEEMISGLAMSQAAEPALDGPESLPDTPDVEFTVGTRQVRPNPGRGVLRLIASILPVEERPEWLEEQRAYLVDLPSRRAQWLWVAAQLVAMPRYAYTVRTGSETESA